MSEKRMYLVLTVGDLKRLLKVARASSKTTYRGKVMKGHCVVLSNLHTTGIVDPDDQNEQISSCAFRDAITVVEKTQEDEEKCAKIAADWGPSQLAGYEG